MCGWTHADFLTYVRRGIANLQDRECTFNDGLLFVTRRPFRANGRHLGRGFKTWNDCFQCLIFQARVRRYCSYRPYYFNMKAKRTCFHFGAQIITRGLYAAQLAWWFQLFPPENFLVISSDSFFRDPIGELDRVNAFFGVKERFTKQMTKYQGMKGNYSKFKDPHKEKALALLTEFYERPNQELYRLLDEVGLGPFPAFRTQSSTQKTEHQSSIVAEAEDDGSSRSSNREELKTARRTKRPTETEKPELIPWLKRDSLPTEDLERNAVSDGRLTLGEDIPFHRMPSSHRSSVFSWSAAASSPFAVSVLILVVLVGFVYMSARRR